MTDEELAEQSNQLWATHTSWGTPDDYNVVPERISWEGWKLGDRVRLTEDGSEGGYVDDEGVIVGFTHTGPGMFNPQARDEILVWLEDAGYDGPTVVSQYGIEAE